MTGPANISLGQQIEAVGLAAERQWLIAAGQSLRRTRTESVEKYDHERLRAARKTLERIRDANAEIRAFVALSPEQQRAALAAAGVQL